MFRWKNFTVFDSAPQSTKDLHLSDWFALELTVIWKRLYQCTIREAECLLNHLWNGHRFSCTIVCQTLPRSSIPIALVLSSIKLERKKLVWQPLKPDYFTFRSHRYDDNEARIRDTRCISWSSFYVEPAASNLFTTVSSLRKRNEVKGNDTIRMRFGRSSQ